VQAPGDWPNLRALSYYLKPTVSTDEQILGLTARFKSSNVDESSLRKFLGRTFN
jgi:hypothetical protein